MVRSAPALVLLALSTSLLACGGGGRWGYARSYKPLSEEESALSGAKELDAPMAALKPEAWRGQKVKFFMVVTDRKQGPGGAAYLTGKTHTLNEINNCENKYDDDTCRVTIKPTGHETVHAIVRLKADDDAGALRVGTGSLVRVIGNLTEATDADDGKLVVQTAFYRQWPIGYYVREGEFRQ
jgi:hypothetical protein